MGAPFTLIAIYSAMATHLSIKQLKDALHARGISAVGMTERRELEAALGITSITRATIVVPADGLATPEAVAAFRASMRATLLSGGLTPAQVGGLFPEEGGPSAILGLGSAVAAQVGGGGLGQLQEGALLGLLASAAAAGVEEAVGAEAAAAHAAAPPPFALGFAGGCDHLQCLRQPAAGSELRACSGCGEARYCSTACQRAAWRPLRAEQALHTLLATLPVLGEQPPHPHEVCVEGHKAWCSKLRAAPRPLRLISRGVSLEVLAAWLACDPELAALAGQPIHKRALAAKLSCCSAFGRTVPAASDAAAVDAILKAIQPTRLLLAFNPCEIPPRDATRGSRPLALLFDVDLGGLTGAALIKAAAAAMAYRFNEEDRLAPGVRYAAGGMERVGMCMPPEYGRQAGYAMDAEGCVTSLERKPPSAWIVAGAV